MKFAAAAALGALALLSCGSAAVAQTPAAAPAPTVSINAISVNVVDIEKMKTFYEQAFGMKVALRIPAQGPLIEYLMSFSGARTDRPLIVLYKVPGPRQPGQDAFGRIVFGSSDAAALARRVVAAGGKGPDQIREGATNMVSDPEGNRIELYQTPAPK